MSPIRQARRAEAEVSRDGVRERIQQEVEIGLNRTKGMGGRKQRGRM